MRVLLDECLPRGLKKHLPGHEVVTVPEAGWAGTKNGELLRVAAGNVDAFELATHTDHLPRHGGIEGSEDARDEWEKLSESIGACDKNDHNEGQALHALLVRDVFISPGVGRG